MTENRVALMRALFADLAERVDAAYEPFAGQQPEAKFDSWLDQRTTEVLPSAARLSIDDAAAAEHFELAFSSAREVAQALGVQMPEIEAFAEAGVDLERFAAALADDPSLAPVPAPHGLGQAAWKQAFEALGGPLLLIADEAEREFAEVDGAALTGAPVAVGAERSAGGDALVSWTLRLVPAQPGPPLLGLSFAQGPHVTLPEMLMLQLSRVVAGSRWSMPRASLGSQGCSLVANSLPGTSTTRPKTPCASPAARSSARGRTSARARRSASGLAPADHCRDERNDCVKQRRSEHANYGGVRATNGALSAPR